MKKIILGFVALVALGACVTAVGTPYGPADARGFGYSSTKIEDNRFRVVFAGDGATPPDIVEDYALLRAAELAQENGYEWFRIVGREVADEQRGGVGVGAGLGGGSFGRRTGVSGGVSGDLGTIGARRFFTARLEILMGAGTPPEGEDIYDAKNLIETIGARIALSQ